jgi:poly-gamma-glutamate capsule biosynthesis protein CapA/YwtB (metallophosphatase superfamily)
VIATFHWGIERDVSGTASQRALAQIALDAGATAVIGAHPHVLQPIRKVGEHRLIAYSLGDVVFSAHSPGTQNTGVLNVSFSGRGVEGIAFRRARIVGSRPVLAP